MVRLGFCALVAGATMAVAACSVSDEPFGLGSSSSGGAGGDSSTASNASGTGAGGMPGACTPPAPYPDPTAPGAFQVGTTSYSSGQVTLGQGFYQMTVGLRATVYYPAMSAGTDVPVAGTEQYPVILMLHGNHPIYRKSDGTVVDCNETLSFSPIVHLKTPQEIQFQYTGATVVPNHFGYAYLGTHLSSAGFVAVSIDGNDANCINLDGRGFVPERAALIQRHVEILQAAANNPDPHLVMLAGHMD